MTQHKLIKKYLEENKTITPLQAYNDLGITKLATRISEMRSRGMEIDGEMVSVMNRFGEECRVMRYSLKECEK